MSKEQWIGIGSLAGLVVLVLALLVVAVPTPVAAAVNGQQIAFRVDNSDPNTVRSLQVQGHNQHDYWVIWGSHTFDPPRAEVHTTDWWWYGRVYLAFTLENGHHGYCTAEVPRRWPWNTVIITYNADNGTCRQH